MRPSRNEPGDTGTRAITSSVSPSAMPSTGVHLLALSTSHTICLRGVADLLGRGAEVQQAAQRRRLDLLRRPAQHPHLEALAHLVEPVLEAAHLGRQALVVEQQRRVREPDRHLGHVLHLHEHVDRGRGR